MKIRHHLLLTFAVCLILYPFTKILNLAALLAFGVLIDADHYFYYLLHFKKGNPLKALNYFTDIKDANHILLVFHCIEWAIPLLVLALYFDIAWYALLGFIIHMVLDYIDSKLHADGRNLSFISWLVKNH
ncbi:MAG: hypothetical protein ABIF92_00885 [archaeon]